MRTLRNVIIGRLSRRHRGKWVVISTTERTSSDNFTTDQRGWASSTFCQLADITVQPCWVVAIYRDVADIMMTMTRRAIVCLWCLTRRTVRRTPSAREWRAVLGRTALTALRCLTSNCTAQRRLPTVSRLGSPTRRPVQYGAAPPNAAALSAQLAG